MLRSSLCDYVDAYILAKGTITISGVGAKAAEKKQNRYLNYLINSSFQGVNRPFVLSFENENDRRLHFQK